MGLFKVLLLHAAFSSLLLMPVASVLCNVGPMPTRQAISSVTSTVRDNKHRKIQLTDERPRPVQTWWETLKKGSIILGILAGLSLCIANVITSTAREDCAPKDDNSPASISALEPTYSDSDGVREFSLKEIKKMTNNLGAALGEGGFGKVYKGNISNYGQVAVKKTTGLLDWKRKMAFSAEKDTLSEAHHENVVQLIGYCTERNQRYLVYNLVSQRDLYRHLHPNKNSPRIPELLTSWNLKVKVLLGAAQGIEYLHKKADQKIIHRDIKSKNILIDENWVAKISDFGLSVFGPPEGNTHVKVDVPGGTDEYMDPEYREDNTRASPSNDVYSFGVVILEVISGCDTDVVCRTVSKIKSGELTEVLDKSSPEPGESELKAIAMMADIATQCVKVPGSDRPNMTDVVTGLQGALALLHS